MECFWSGKALPGQDAQLVIPDGCTDLIFTMSGGRVQGSVVGAMTRAITSAIPPGGEIFGVRFHPAMSYGLIAAPISELTDVTADIEDLLGPHGRILAERIGGAASPFERAVLLADVIRPSEPATPVQRATEWLLANRGAAAIDALASQAALSPRQFRRRCIEQAGIGPKMLCRILRFRRAAIHIASGHAVWADFALEHGYYDQAHLINEFREFSGLTPAAYECLFSPPNPLAAANS